MIGELSVGVRDFLARSGVRGPLSRLEGARVALIVAGASGVYGGVMAAHGGFEGDRVWMVLYGAAKVPLLFTATMALAVPSFYVANLVAGVAGAFGRVWRALVDYQISVALQLGAVAPVTLLVNLSQEDYRVAQAWSTLLFAVASWNAQAALARAYEPLEAEAPVHCRLRRAWLVLYAFVGVQMAWDLRPFVGSPDMPVAFFRDTIGNAYVEIPKVLWEAIRALFG